jgi:serine/threonine protein kinase
LVAEPRLKNRYEIRETLGQGGMGVVYRAFDSVIQREVALKTIRDTPDPMALETFYKECGVLASLAHPNIIEIFDRGEFEENGTNKPYFVMPLLPGATLESLIRASSPRLTVERVVEIISQICRGLQAAHERGLVHRDLKPSNIFVMDDDSVKIIDFGVAHILDARTTMNLKGTLAYMAPEQIEMKALSPLTDIFSLGVVAYETLCSRRPFQGRNQNEMVEAILNQIPPGVSDFNSSVNQSISRVIHKALAKQPFHRFASAKEFSDNLQKALRNEPIEFFDPTRFQPRVEKAQKAFGQGDFQFASEILDELNAEGYIDPAITTLHRQIQSASRQKTVQQLLLSARTRVEENEYPLALQKIQEILQLDPNNPEASSLKEKLESRRMEEKVDDWFRLARQHIENCDFTHAREALQNLLNVKPNESQALQLLTEVGRREQEYQKSRQKKQELYQNAVQFWQGGEVTAALTRLKLLLELDQRSPDRGSSESGALYQNLYKQVHSEHDAINNAFGEARRLLTERNFSAALAICDTYLTKYPTHALFQSLKYDIAEQERQELSGQIAEIHRRVEAEPDLDRRVSILKEAAERFPKEANFAPALRLMRDKRDLVSSIVAKAQLHEEQGQFNEALGQWEILKTIYSSYPGLDYEIERVIRRREQQTRAASKARWVEQIDLCIETADYLQGREFLRQALDEFPQDSEFVELERFIAQKLEQSQEAQALLSEGQALCAQKHFDEGLEILARAQQMDDRNPAIRLSFVKNLVEHARILLDTNWQQAELLLKRALELEPSNSQALSFRTLIADCKREESVDQCISQARQLQAAGELNSATTLLEQGLSRYPNEFRLSQLLNTLKKGLEEGRRRSLDELQQIERNSETTHDATTLQQNLERAQKIANLYPDDAQFHTLTLNIQRRQEMITPVSKKAFEMAASATPPDLHLKETIPARIKPISPFASATRLDGTGVEAGGAVDETLSEALLSQPHSKENIQAEDVHENLTSSHSTLVPTDLVEGQLERRNWPATLKARKKVVSLLLMLAAGGILIAVFWGKKGGADKVVAPLNSTLIRLEVKTTPPGARILVNGQYRGLSNFELDLSEGVHHLRAEMQGYSPEFLSLDLKSGKSPAPLEITLSPLRAAIESPAQVEPVAPTDIVPSAVSATRKNAAKIKSQTAVPETKVKTVASEIPLQSVHGVLRVKRFPQNTLVTMQSRTDKEPRVITEDSLDILEGEYTLVASAPGYARLSVPVKVESGKTNDVELKLQPVPDYERDWKTAWTPPGGWVPEGEWIVRTGGSFVMSTVPTKPGTFTFTVWRKSKTAQWFVNYRDDKNYDLFELDKKNLIRTQIREGKKSRPVKIAHQLDKQTQFQVQITVTKENVTHRVFDGQNWKVLDEYKWGQPEDPLGKFGFFVPGHDQIGLSSFSFKSI